MEISFYKNNSPTNKINKSLSTLFSVTDAQFREPFNEENPTVLVALNDFKGADYAVIMGLNYFISGINHIDNTLTELTLQLDYLASYKSVILGATAYIDRATTGYEKLLKDDGIPILAKSLIQNVTFEPSAIAKFSDDEADGAYVLLVNKAV